MSSSQSLSSPPSPPSPPLPAPKNTFTGTVTARRRLRRASPRAPSSWAAVWFVGVPKAVSARRRQRAVVGESSPCSLPYVGPPTAASSRPSLAKRTFTGSVPRRRSWRRRVRFAGASWGHGLLLGSEGEKPGSASWPGASPKPGTSSKLSWVRQAQTARAGESSSSSSPASSESWLDLPRAVDLDAEWRMCTFMGSVWVRRTLLSSDPMEPVRSKWTKVFLVVGVGVLSSSSSSLKRTASFCGEPLFAASPARWRSNTPSSSVLWGPETSCATSA
mmetsp:Transcript_19088/g.50439  ORF Transcript_19088/g.50439 Transcript_19088/m.50439 type:complete len:275 (-) Transcript_19088:145-969(-)